MLKILFIFQTPSLHMHFLKDRKHDPSHEYKNGHVKNTSLIKYEHKEPQGGRKNCVSVLN